MQVAIAPRCSRIINQGLSSRVHLVLHSVLKPPHVSFKPNLGSIVTGARTLSSKPRLWSSARGPPSALKINAFPSDFPSRPSQNPGIIGDQDSSPNNFAFFSTEAAPAPKQEKKASLAKTGADGERVPETKIVAALAKYLWMKDNSEFRLRVIAALGLLICTKAINVQVPFLFKLAVDWLSTSSGSAAALADFTAANSTALALFASPAAVLIGYGIARLGASAFNELRIAIFFKRWH